jgi:dipeptidyl aminopeptidase/acylaminoacyl peptidase
MKTCSLLLLFLLTAFMVAPAESNELKKFVKHAEFEQVKISPDGKTLAVRTEFENKKVLAFLDIETKNLKYLFRLNGKDNVGSFYWVNNERVVAMVTTSYGPLDIQQYIGKLYAVNSDGSKATAIFGWNTKRSGTWSNSGKHIASGWAYIASTLDDDDENILVSITPWRNGKHLEPSPADLIKINVYTGKQRHLMRSPGRGNGFVLDNADVPRFAYGSLSYDDYDLYYRESDGKWNKFKFPVTADDVWIQGFNKTNTKVYFIAEKDGDTGTLYSYNLKTQKINKIYQNSNVEIYQLLKNHKGIPYGVEINEDYSNFLFFNKKVEHAQLHKDFYTSFKGDSVSITSSTKNGQQLVIKTSGDKNPGTYYLYDSETKQVKYLLSRADWLKSKDLARVEPFKFKNRDGIQLFGYLTLPKGKVDKNLPLVVNPHGGPHGTRDYWEFDWRTQAIASQGYAVLNVNFQGSGGYGKKFEQAGYREWGGKIQRDIIDATKWAINQGIADKERVCIYGGSFGAYSALQSAILAPNLFKCTIGASGVYDLPLMHESGDIPKWVYGNEYLSKAIGNNELDLKAFSPSYNVDRLKIPVLLIHGGADKRTPIAQAISLEKALKAQKHQYKTLYIDNEYHGFVKESNRLKAMETIIQFLDEHIGS